LRKSGKIFTSEHREERGGFSGKEQNEEREEGGGSGKELIKRRKRGNLCGVASRMGIAQAPEKLS
jgi:hypothetical protein